MQPESTARCRTARWLTSAPLYWPPVSFFPLQEETTSDGNELSIVAGRQPRGTTRRHHKTPDATGYLSMDSAAADAIHGAVEVVDTLRTAGEQAQLVDEVLQAPEQKLDDGHGVSNGHYDSEEHDRNGDSAGSDAENEPVTTVHDVLDTHVVGPQYDIDFGRLGNFLLKCGINLVLPFVNGMMMGFGEIFAHELCFRHNWRFARVSPPERMLRARERASERTSAVLGGDSVLLH